MPTIHALYLVIINSHYFGKPGRQTAPVISLIKEIADIDIAQVQFAQKPLLAWDHREGQLPLVALSGPEGAELYVWQPDGTKLLTRVLDTADLSACRYRGGTLAVLYGKKLLVASGDQYVIREVREVRDICLSAEGKVILVYSGKAGYFDPNISKEEPVT